jgi:putative transposase
MKLTRKKLLETLRRKNEGWTTYQTRKIAGISVRRVNQVWNEYLATGKTPEIGRKVGRPPKQASEYEVKVVKEAYEKYRVSASTLERCIKRDYSIHIPHNRVHKIMLQLKLAKAKNKKDIRKKKWIRYQRRHSLTAVHIDWHYCSVCGGWAFGVQDDASRKMLALVECSSPTTEKSIEGMKEALKFGHIRQCISDHGSQFVANITDGNSRFEKYLKSKGIKQILCRIKHPQSNGKIEKWFDTYKNHRHAFKTKEDFLKWFNEVRPHRSLNFNDLETPEQAFQRKMRKE